MPVSLSVTNNMVLSRQSLMVLGLGSPPGVIGMNEVLMMHRYTSIALSIVLAVLLGPAPLPALSVPPHYEPTATLATGSTDLGRKLTLDELNDVYRIQQIMATYSRAIDRHDGMTVACLFASDGMIELDWNDGGTPRLVAERLDRGTIYYAAGHLYAARQPGAWDQHLIADPLIEVDGDAAKVEYRLLVVRSQSDPKKIARGGVVGSAAIRWSGYYQNELRKIDGVWKIVLQRAILDLQTRRPDLNHPPVKIACPD